LNGETRSFVVSPRAKLLTIVLRVTR